MVWLRSALDRHVKASRMQRIVRCHGRQRTQQIQDALRHAAEGYTLICGDSHVEMLGQCPLPAPVVNAGIVGATASTYVGLLKRLQMPRPARCAILIIGTNDILSRRALSEQQVAAFRSNVDRIIGRLQAVAGQVMIAAVPPVPDLATSKRRCLSVEVYTYELNLSCAAHGCSCFDPFAFSRGERFGQAVPDIFADGIHLADYRPLATSLLPHLGGDGPIPR